MKKVLFFILGLGLASVSMAQTKENPWTVGVYGVKTEYLGDLTKYSNEWTTSNLGNDARNTIFNFNLFYGGGALSFDRYLNNYFDLGLYSSFGTVGYKDKSNVERIPRSFNAKLSNTNVHVRIKIFGPDDDAKFVPYLNFGVGLLAYFKGKGVTATNANEGDTLAVTAAHNPSYGLIVNGGVGLEYRINSHFGVRYQADFGWTNRDNVDFYTRDGAKDWQLQHSLGVTYSFNFDKKAKAIVQPAPATDVVTPAK